MPRYLVYREEQDDEGTITGAYVSDARNHMAAVKEAHEELESDTDTSYVYTAVEIPKAVVKIKAEPNFDHKFTVV